MISEVKRCQDANGDGYAGGVPNGAPLWKEIKEGRTDMVWKYWVPWYNVHKMYAGLRDAWVYCGNAEARDMFIWFCDWCVDEISAVSDEGGSYTHLTLPAKRGVGVSRGGR